MPARPPIPFDFLPQVPALTVTSDDIRDGERLPQAHVFDDWDMNGENLSPHLRWSGAPEATRSFAVTCYDPDAPTQGGFWHWLLFDLPADLTEIPTGYGTADAKPGTHACNDFGVPAYGGAAPPPGRPHRYLFAVHALGVDTLGLAGETPANVVGFTITANTLARGYLAPVYET